MLLTLVSTHNHTLTIAKAQKYSFPYPIQSKVEILNLIWTASKLASSSSNQVV